MHSLTSINGGWPPFSIWGAILEDVVKYCKRAEDLAGNAIGVVGACLWMFDMVANCGVMAGLGPDKYDLQYFENPDIDEESTRRLLQTMVLCLNLQYLPPEEAKKPIPIISRSKFSLKL